MSENLTNPSKLRIDIVGGSIGGLCAGVALRSRGFAPSIHERGPAVVDSRGAGIVVQPNLQRLLRDGGCPPLPTTSCRVRRSLERSGGAGQDRAMPQQFTSWSAIHSTLLAALPADTVRYNQEVEVERSGGAIGGAESGLVGTADPDLVVWADGQASSARRHFLPDVASSYAGYVAWRGTVDEADAGPQLTAFFDDAFTFCDDPRGGHCLVYAIPGDGEDVRPGHRRLNWVWYVQADDAALARLLMDRSGIRHSASLGAGMVTQAVVDDLRDQADAMLHPSMSDLVNGTAEPFLQAIVDVAVQKTVFGRACLLGDAGFVVRPHTAGATAKAAWEASQLAQLLARSDGDVTAALEAFETVQLEHGRRLLAHGMALGRRWAEPRPSHVGSVNVRAA